MRAILQRVSQSSVSVDQSVVGKIENGWLVLLGVSKDDTEEDVAYLVDKTAHLRAFKDNDGKMNLSIKDVKGSILVISQFTLYGDCRKGRRPSFTNAAPPEKGNDLYEKYVSALQKEGIHVEKGTFQAYMQVELVNDGPVTMLLDSKKEF